MSPFRYPPLSPTPAKRPSHSARRGAIAGLSVVAGLIMALAGSGIALGITSCRTDPTVTLSNGVSVQLWDSVGTDLSNVRGVSYVLHVPRGIRVSHVEYDSTGYLEDLQVVDDQNGTHYSLTTTVSVNGSKASVTANAIRRDGTTATQNGSTSQSITLNWCT